MKVVHINTFDRGGGAAIACGRHCEAMISMGLESVMITARKVTYKTYIKNLHLGWKVYLFTIFELLHKHSLRKKLSPKGVFSVMKYGMPFWDNKDIRDADVIFIHWVNSNGLSINGVRKILSLNKPTYWYMHDMFPITGGCHHSLDCDGYKNSCNSCPLISNPKYKNIATKQLQRKIKKWDSFSNLHFVTPSRWLGDCVKESVLGVNHSVTVIPNVINTELFKPLPYSTKALFNLDEKKYTILFSADLTGSIYKGSEYTIECLKQLDPSRYEGLIIGKMPKGLEEIIPLKLISTGYLQDELSLVIAYNACDTLIISSVAENYPNVVLEAMSCGVPCVGFETGGIPELIINNKTGYITEEKSSKSLKSCIERLLSDDNKYLELSNNSREFVLNHNSYVRASEIYREVIVEHKN